MTYAQITLAISDGCGCGMEGFAPLSDRLPSSVFTDAVEDGLTMSITGDAHAVFVDLMDGEHNQAGEKCISLAQAAHLLGLPAAILIPMGRQRLAQINDECAEYIAARSRLKGDLTP